MDSVELKELDHSLEGIKLGFESIDNLTKLYDNIKNCNYILVPSRVTKTINIALEHTYKTNKLENYISLSLENNEDTTIFDKILSTIKSIWKKIVETWDYIWDKIVGFFNTTKSKELEKEILNNEERIRNILYGNEKEYQEVELLVNSNSLSEPLRYMHDVVKGEKVLLSVEKDIPVINSLLGRLIESIKRSYDKTIKYLNHSVELSKISKVSVLELDTELFETFFENIDTQTSQYYQKINNYDQEILEHMITVNGVINYSKSSCIKGFIKGGGLFFYTIEGKEDKNAKLFECLAIDKISDENDQIKLFYLPKDLLVSYNSIMKSKLRDFTKTEENFLKSSKDVRIQHNNVRKLIDSFIKDENFVYEQDPEDFRAKFEVLKNISHSMLRFVLEFSKGFGMYQDTINYYVKYGKASLEFYEKDMKKGS